MPRLREVIMRADFEPVSRTNNSDGPALYGSNRPSTSMRIAVLGELVQPCNAPPALTRWSPFARSHPAGFAITATSNAATVPNSILF